MQGPHRAAGRHLADATSGTHPMRTCRRIRVHRSPLWLAALAFALLSGGCGVAERASLDPSAGAASVATDAAPVPDTTTPATDGDAGTRAAAAPEPSPDEVRTIDARTAPPRVSRHERSVFARADGIDFHLPSRRVEHLGYHQSGHDGAARLRPADNPVPHTVLDSRRRGTGRRTAVDIVVHPRSRITAPVSGTVIAASPYVLYCVHRDQLVFIAPDAAPDLIVKVLHIRGVQVDVGDRVEAGVSRIARGARVLPFASQVDEVTSRPPWPHVHVEMIDPAVPDRPTPGPGCP